LPWALADDAFEERGIKDIQVTAPSNSLHLKWKLYMLNMPVFRRAVHTAEGIRSAQWPFPPNSIPMFPCPAVATTSERNQVMDHSRADIFERYYISVKVKRDMQSAVATAMSTTVSGDAANAVHFCWQNAGKERWPTNSARV